MSTSSFTMGSISQDVRIDQKNIEAQFDGLNSSLKIFLSLTLRPSEQSNVSFDFLSIYGDLLYSNGRIQAARYVGPFIETVFDKEKQTGVWLNYLLNDEALHTIQKLRDGHDVLFIIDFKFIAVRKETQSPPGAHAIWNPQGAREFSGSIQFSIPKSQWVENFLPKFGYPGFKMIEIPINHRLIKEAYNDIIDEFNLAEEYFNKNDYNKCVGHCRHTLDHLTRNLKKIKDDVESETAFKWLAKVDEATLTWIDEVNKALTSISSKTHHSGLKKDFTRIEAESIYLVTLGLLNFVGQASADNS